MTQLFFRYGAMSSGESVKILKAARNYETQGRGVTLMASSVDDRSGVGAVASRVGLHREAEPISEDLDLSNYVLEMSEDDVESGNETVACVLVDEAQPLKKRHALECAKAAGELKIPVMTSDLKDDFQNHLFEGSENLLIFADKIEEMKIICHYCGHKAIMSSRVDSGRPVYEGEQVQIDGDESYYPVCRFHYFHPDKQR